MYDINVDLYDDGDYDLFLLKDNVQLHGHPWNGGTGKPELVVTDTWVMSDSAINCLVENFLFTLNHTEQVDDWVKLINILDGFGIAVKDCKFTGFMSSMLSVFLNIDHSHAFRLDHNEFVGIRNNSLSETAGHIMCVIWIFASNDVLIRHNEIHDIGYRDLGTPTSYYPTMTRIFLTKDDSALTCENMRIINNLIYDITDQSQTLDGGHNLIDVFDNAAVVNYPSNTGFVWANNTVDDISAINDDPLVNGRVTIFDAADVDSTWTVKNSIISNLAPVTEVDDENWHKGFLAHSCSEDYPVDYSNCFNFGIPSSPGIVVDDYVFHFYKGEGSYGLEDWQDPKYNMIPGSNWYHPTNPVIEFGADDGTEMGAFGGPDGDWLPPSQEE
jgi:hypothetical protein